MTSCDTHLATRATGRVLVCAPDEESQRPVTRMLSDLGWNVDVAVGIDRGLQLFESTAFDVCLLVDGNEGEYIHRLQKRFAALEPETQILCLRSGADGTLSVQEAVEESQYPAVASFGAGQLGNSGELRVAMQAAARRIPLIEENRRLKRQLNSRLSYDLIAQDEAMQAVCETIRETADADRPVLLQGETGTELSSLAQAIHQYGRRSHRSFVVLDCSVLSSDCLAQALLGDDAPASRRVDLSGAKPAQADSQVAAGLLEQAAGGTLVLENVDRAALPLQKKLCQLCDLGVNCTPRSPNLRAANVRLIATTHADLHALCEAGRFRADLLGWLEQNSIEIPPLRDRPDAISPLTERFLKKFALAEGKPPKRLTLDALMLLKQHGWPGNVRELQNVIERACTLDGDERLTADVLRPWIAAAPDSPQFGSASMSLKEMERKLIETTFARCGGNRERTAHSLGIGLRTLSGKLREFGYPPRGGPGSNLAVVRRKAA